MKHSVLLFALCLALILVPFAGRADVPEGDFLYMINVGKGDAILLRVSGRYYLIDTAKAGAWDAVQAALEEYGVTELEGVFLTHIDKDHSGGLKKLAKSGVTVKNWYASAFYTCGESDHPMVKALKKTDAKVTYLKAGDSVDGVFRVLGPIRRDPQNDDDDSLVMLLDNGACRVLLTGDMEGNEEFDLVMSGADFSCDIFKVPNHADDDVCRYMDLKSLNARVALISTDPYEKPGTPDPILVQRLTEAGMKVCRTDLTETGILVALDETITVTEK